LSLVAVENDEVVGHILFSALTIETEHAVLHAVSLAPMAVVPDHQRFGLEYDREVAKP
jgi:putative acetyltransferase